MVLSRRESTSGIDKTQTSERSHTALQIRAGLSLLTDPEFVRIGEDGALLLEFEPAPASSELMRGSTEINGEES